VNTHNDPYPEPVTDLAPKLVELRARLAGAELPLELNGAAEARTTRTELIDQLDDYILPRLARLDAPLLAVLGGSTGAGKSTITNSLVGVEVTTPGVLRPTTRTPVLVCHPEDEVWFTDGGVLPELPRSTGVRPESGYGLHIVTSDKVPAGLGILDSPDIDSVETANHDLASQLLGAADLWLFTTTAARYADAVPWQYLQRARERSIALALIINRIPAGSEDEVAGHLQAMLDDKGLDAATLFAIPEHELVDGRLVQGIPAVRGWLDGLVADAEQRDALVRQSLDGALASMGGRVDRLTTAISEQTAAADVLRSHARMRYDEGLSRIDSEVASGHLLRGEVLEQWREIVGTGEFMDRMQRGVGRVRDSIVGLFTGRKAPEAAVQGELEANLAILVREAGDQSALETVEGWDTLPGGPQALANAPRAIDRSSAELRTRVEQAVDAWEMGVFEMVREMAEPKLAVARTLSFGINSIGVALMIAVFSSTGGITGGEAAVAGGTAAVSQTVLSAVFGEQAVRDLVRLSREDLEGRIAEIFDEEFERFEALLDGVPGADEVDGLEAAAREVEATR